MVQPIPNESASSAPQRPKSRFGLGAITALIGVGFLLVFIFQNSQSVDLDFLLCTRTMFRRVLYVQRRRGRFHRHVLLAPPVPPRSER